MKQLRNLLRRSREEQRLLLAALGWLVCVRVGLWLLPYRTLRPLLESVGKPATGAADDLLARRVAWAIANAARFVPRASCVTQALAARMVLARRGVASEVCYGVGRSDGRIIAHAWLESGGRAIVGDESLHRLMPLAPLEQPIRARRTMADDPALTV